MSGDEERERPPKPPDDATVFAPRGAPVPPPAGRAETEADALEAAWLGGEAEPAAEAPAAAPVADAPQASWASGSANWTEPPSAEKPADWTGDAAPEPPPQPPPRQAQPSDSPPPGEGRIVVGMVLNNIYSVQRPIGSGGMAEVFEAVNVHNVRERVAIKSIRSHLARDPNALEMFVREADALSRISDPAVVPFRQLGRDGPTGVYFIATSFIDGKELGDLIGRETPGEAELAALLRRLASGLRAAHEVGVIHRDISPDNILLPDGRLDRATIVDFGIAKNLDPGKQTIIGDGVAGKLWFMAPEQIGEYGGQIGAWTDIYSLGLVLLGLMRGRQVDMGANYAQALEKRREVPDLSTIPERLRPIFAKMLAPRPTDRFRAMADLLAALDRVTTAQATPPVKTGPSLPAWLAAPNLRSGPVLIGAGVLVAALVFAVIIIGVLHGPKPTVTAASGAAPAATPAAAVSVDQVRRAVEAALPAISCSWIDVDDVSQTGGGFTVRLSGAAGSAGQAQDAIAAAVRQTGANVSQIDGANLGAASPQSCQALDAFRALREAAPTGLRRITSEQTTWQQQASDEPCEPNTAKVVVNLDVGDPNADFAIVGVDAQGRLQQIYADRAAAIDFNKRYAGFFADAGGGKYSSIVCYDQTGLAGEVLITGRGPFSLGLPNATAATGKAVDSNWAARFAQQAQANGWKTSMVWYRVVAGASPGASANAAM